MGEVAGLIWPSTCTKVGWECTFVTPFPPPSPNTSPCGLKKAVHTPCFTPRSPSNTHRPHTPINFIAGIYYLQRTGARIPLVVPSLTPCARPCEFMSLALEQTLPPPTESHSNPSHHPFYPPFPRQISNLSCVCPFTPPPPSQDLPPRRTSWRTAQQLSNLPPPGVP